jgi:hypothetical protein
MEGGIKYRICQLGSDIQNYFLLFKQTKKTINLLFFNTKYCIEF